MYVLVIFEYKSENFRHLNFIKHYSSIIYIYIFMLLFYMEQYMYNIYNYILL